MPAHHPAQLHADPARAAAAARLRHVTDSSPGLRRVRHGRGFLYLTPTGGRVTDPATLRRIAQLAIPPAWEDVWICPSPQGHLQATGLDDRRRKQYLYHPRFREVREQAKFTHLLDFARALPRIRRTTARHLHLPGLPRRKVVAAVVQLLARTALRVGNDEYARTNRHYGLTTIRNHHARVSGPRIHLEFRGKSGVHRAIDLHDPTLARIVRACQNLPGQELFGYTDDAGRAVDITSTDVNGYLHEITGRNFTAKDFRTWAGTLLTLRALARLPLVPAVTRRRKAVCQAVSAVAAELGNTVAVCRRCYIHPALLEGYLDGSLDSTLRTLHPSATRVRPLELEPDEKKLIAYLRDRSRPVHARAA